MKLRNALSRFAELDFAVLLFLVSAFLGIFFAHDLSLTGVILVYLTTGFILYLLISRVGKNEKAWVIIAWVTVSACFLIALYYFTQYGRLENAEKLRAFSKLGTLLDRIFPKMDFFAIHYNTMATFLEGPLFLSIGLALNSRRPAGRIIGWLMSGFMVVVLFLTVSRGAWLAVVAAAFIWLSLYWKPARFVLAAGAGGLLLLMIVILIKGDIFVLNQIPVINRTLAPLFVRPDRFSVYRDAIYLLQDYLITGGGIGGQFAMLQARYTLVIQVPFMSYAHQLFLEMWLEQGLIGIFAFLCLIASIYLSSSRYRGTRPDWLFDSTWIGLTAIFLHGLTDARPYVDRWLWLIIFILLALHKSFLLRRNPRPTPQWVKPLPYAIPLVFVLAVLLSCGSIHSTWESNLGAVQQARGELHPGLSDAERESFLQQSIVHYQRAIDLNGKNRTAQQRLGQILVNKNQFNEGIGYLEAAYQIDPENRTTQKELGYTYAWLGRIDQSIAMLASITEAKQEMETYSWWWSTQGRQDLSTYAKQVADGLQN
jgi:O-antigen ligase